MKIMCSTRRALAVVEQLSLDALLARADVVSLHCPLTPATHHLINARTLAEMKPGALLLNTARGPIVDQPALIEALEEGKLGGAGLDVFEDEPQVPERLAGHPHIIQFSSVGGRIGPIGRGAYAAAKWGVEGFSEVLAKEVGPLGVKVTIIEPGGFRTDFAGSSSSIDEGNPAYDATVGAVARFQREYSGAQPGDPAKAASVVVEVANLGEPPLRLLLGSDAVRAAEAAAIERSKADAKWRDLSVSTDFDAKQ